MLQIYNYHATNCAKYVEIGEAVWSHKVPPIIQKTCRKLLISVFVTLIFIYNEVKVKMKGALYI